MIPVRFVFVLIALVAAFSLHAQQSQTIEVGAHVEGRLPPGGLASWMLTLSTPAILSSEARSQFFDTQLTIYDSAGEQLAFNDDWGGFNFSRITGLSLQAGVYELHVNSWDPAEFGIYTLVVNPAGANDAEAWQAQQIFDNALNLYFAENYAGANDLFQQARARFNDAGDPLTADSLYYWLSSIQSLTGNSAEAARLSALALQAMRDANNESRVIDILAEEGLNFYLDSQFSLAIASDERALALVRADGNRVAEAYFLRSIGGSYEAMRDYEAALDYYEPALIIRQEIEDAVGVADSLRSLAFVYSMLDRYAEARTAYEQVIALYQEFGDQAGAARSLESLGFVYEMLEDDAGARSAYESALAVYTDLDEPDSVSYIEGLLIRVYTRLGRAYADAGDFAAAIEIYEALLPIQLERGSEEEARQLLNTLGNYNAQLANYAAAFSYYEQALELARGLGNRAAEASALNNLGSVANNLGNYEQALQFYEAALPIRREVGDRQGEGVTLNNLGLLLTDLGRYQEAVVTLEEALAIRREVGDQLGEARTLNNLGGVHRNLGNITTAQAFFEQSLTLRLALGDRRGEAATLVNLASLKIELGDYAQAQNDLAQAIALAQELGALDTLASAYQTLGGVYHTQGQLQEARQYYEQALALRIAIGDRAGTSTTLTNLANIFSAQGNMGEAVRNYLEALSISQDVGNRATEAAILTTIGRMYQEQGQYPLALEYLDRALLVAEEIGDLDYQVSALSAIGIVYRNTRQFDSALEAYNRILEIKPESSATNEAATLNNIAMVYVEQGSAAEAEDYLLRALNLVEGTGNNIEIGVLNNFGRLYRVVGQYDLSQDYYQRALLVIDDNDNRPEAGFLLANLAVSYDVEGEAAQALNYYLQALPLLEDQLEGAVLDQAIGSLLQSTPYVNIATRLPVLYLNQGDLTSAFNYAERGRAILARNELRSGAINFRDNVQDRGLLEQERQLRLQIEQAQNRLTELNLDLNAAREQQVAAQTVLEAAQSSYDRLIDRMQLEGGYITREFSLETGSLQAVQAALPADTTLLLYGLSEHGGYALLVTSNSIQGVEIAASESVIDTAVRAYAADRQGNSSALRALYDLVFAPIADEISTTHLMISPDGVLNYVPFAALQAPDSSYLIDRYTMSMIPSATVWMLLNEREPQSQATAPGIVLAQPDAPGLPRLQNALTEARDVAALLSVEARTDASENDLRELSTGAEIVYISAHAELNRFAPLFSTIHLRSAAPNDGRFEVREIYELDLAQGTELVILSGCETGSGGRGEDFGLLTRAFLSAGVDTVVASLWSVDDAATALLITEFIDNRQNMGDAAALRDAMLVARQVYPDPYYWASFVLVGQP